MWSGVQDKPEKGDRDQDKQVYVGHANDFAFYPRNHGKPEAVTSARLRDDGRLSQGRACRDREKQMHLGIFWIAK